MSVRHLFFACAAALLVSGHSQAVILQDLTVSHNYSGKLESNIDSSVGTSLGNTPDGEYGEEGFSISGSDGMSLDIKGTFYKLPSSESSGYFFFGNTVLTELAAGAPVEFSLSTTIEFTLDHGGTMFAWTAFYLGADTPATYSLTVNGTAIEETGNYVLQAGLNTIILTGEFSTASLNSNLSDIFGSEFTITAIPEPGSWALIACGAGVAMFVARRKASRVTA